MAARVSRGNLMHSHPSPEIRAAMVSLTDALTQYERATGMPHLIIVKADSGEGLFEYRSLGGGPANDRDSDEDLLGAFDDTLQPQKRA